MFVEADVFFIHEKALVELKKRYILAIDDLLELINGAERQLAAHQNAARPSELMINQYLELRTRYKIELSNLMAELNQEVQQLVAVAA